VDHGVHHSSYTIIKDFTDEEKACCWNFTHFLLVGMNQLCWRTKEDVSVDQFDRFEKHRKQHRMVATQPEKAIMDIFHLEKNVLSQ